MRHCLPFVALGALLMGCATRPTTTAVDDATAEQIREIGRRCVEADGMVGVSIGVAVNGKPVFAEGFGHSDTLRSISTDEHTMYDIASVGKQFTAAAILKLAEEKKLRLDQRVREIIPELPEHFPNATIEQLLRHTSGFVSGDLDELDPPEEYKRARYGVELLSDVGLQEGSIMFEPEESWVYCNSGYLVLGLIAEAVSGMRYDVYVRDAVLRPIGLADMTVCQRADPPRMSQGIHRTSDGISEVPFIDMTAYGGQGSICSSVVDLLRWSKALNTGKVISRKSLDAFRSPSMLRGTEATAEVPYAMAQRIGEIGGYDKVGHTGTFDGGSASLAYYPDAELEIAVLSNTRGNGTPHARAVETEIAKLILGVEAEDVLSLGQPVPAEVRSSVPGKYTNGKVFETSFDGDLLVVRQDEEEIERLVYVGDMTFRDPENPDVTQWFAMDGDQVGWWIYNNGGSYIEVLRRMPTPIRRDTLVP